MTTLLCRLLERKQLPPTSQDLILTMLGGVVPRGVCKVFWKGMLARWEETPGEYRNPLALYMELQSYQLMMVWSPVDDADGLFGCLVATPPVDEGLAGHRVCLTRRAGKDRHVWYISVCTILEVKDQAFRHTSAAGPGNREYWCSIFDVIDITCEVVYRTIPAN